MQRFIGCYILNRLPRPLTPGIQMKMLLIVDKSLWTQRKQTQCVFFSLLFTASRWLVSY